jgi:hypothetical protein
MVTNLFDEVLSDLPKKVRDRVKACPKSGQGVNPWLFNTALSLTNYFEDHQVIEILNASVSCPGREQEIEKAVSNARRIAEGEGGSEPRVLWPAVDYATVHKIVVNSPVSLEKLRSASPVKEPKSEEIIDNLFPDNPLLCLARKKELFWTKPREFWRGKESGMQFIVPNAMSKPIGKTKEGKDSVRCLDNTGERQFLVVEFDIAEIGKWEPYVKDWQAKGISTFDAQAALLVHLATKDVPRFTITMAVHSGKKSLHGWFRCQGLPEEQTRAFMARAARLGADPATWTKCQLVRMMGINKGSNILALGSRRGRSERSRKRRRISGCATCGT